MIHDDADFAEFLTGWMVYLCGTFALFFAFSWPPLQSFIIEKCWLLFLVTVTLWAGAFVFIYVAAYASWSPLRVKEGYIKGTKLIARRGWWALFEYAALYIHIVAGAFGTLMQLMVAFFRQFMRVSRLDMATFGGLDQISDPGHAGYKAMLMTDHILSSPLINVAVLTLERELQRRKLFRKTPINDVIAIILKTTGMMLDVADCEADQRQLKKRRTARTPLVRWQLGVLQYALAERDMRTARNARGLIAQRHRACMLQQQQHEGQRGNEEDSDNDEDAAGVAVTREEATGGGEKRKMVGKISKENAEGRRKRYGVFLPLPGHVGAATNATVWDAEDVNAHVRFANSLEFSPSDNPPTKTSLTK